MFRGDWNCLTGFAGRKSVARPKIVSWVFSFWDRHDKVRLEIILITD
jgi:hypothetical protein